MLVKLTHPEPNYELWVDPTEIVLMERYDHPKTIIITQQNDRPSVTALVMKNGKTIACKETPQEIFKIMGN
jgi:hypothetical protein